MRKAWLVRKRVQHLPEQAHLVLGSTTTPWWSLARTRRIRQTHSRSAGTVGFPEPAAVICVEGANAEIGKKMWKAAADRVV